MGPPEFLLRLPLAELRDVAARYPVVDDPEIEAISRATRERGYYTREDFLKVSRWKGVQVRPRREENDEETVLEVTRLALTTPIERLRIEALTLLHGVTWPSASVLLHFGHREPYPILEPRALWSFGIERPPEKYEFEFWWGYVQVCRSLAEETGVDMRTLDRALWQFSKEQLSARSG
jgi:DNA-binding transcriptional regulator YhcF (GntR family)